MQIIFSLHLAGISSLLGAINSTNFYSYFFLEWIQQIFTVLFFRMIFYIFFVFYNIYIYLYIYVTARQGGKGARGKGAIGQWGKGAKGQWGNGSNFCI
jgi:hypothetical protein